MTFPPFAPAGSLAMLRPLRHRDFRFYLIGALVSAAGNWMQTVAEGWLAYRLTNSTLALGIVMAAGAIPLAVLTLVGGALADRLPKRNLLIAAYGLAVLEPLALAFLTWSGRIQVWHMILLSMTLGSLAALATGGRSSIISEIVPEGELTNAVALYSLANWIFGRIGGAVLAGWLIATVGETSCFLFNAISFGVITVLLIMMRLPPPAAPAPRAGRGPFAEVADHLRRIPATIGLLILIGLSAFFGMTIVFLLPALVRQVLGGTSLEVGWLTAAYGLGSVAGGMALANSTAASGRFRTLVLGRFLSPLFLLVLGLSRFFPLSFVALLGLGWGVASQNIFITAQLQTLAGPSLRGRVMSLYSLVVGGGLAVGTVALGWTAEHWALPAVLIAGGVVLALGSGLVLWRVPQVRGTM